MINAIIADDEKMSRNTLKKMLELHCPSVEIISEAEDASEAASQVEKFNPELLFLDIAMPGKNGIDFLKELGEINFEVIFVSAYDKYILQAMRLSAVDFLQKPVDEEQLIYAVNNAFKRIAAKTNNKQVQAFLHNVQEPKNYQDMQLCVPGIKGFQVIKIRDIIYCEAENTYTTIFLQDNQKLLASRPLADYEQLLQDTSFVRIHKSYLINIQQLKEYQKGEGGVVVMSNGKHLEVSRRKKEYFVSYMKEHFKY
jgi:two-component system, LytTR family, response regulator